MITDFVNLGKQGNLFNMIFNMFCTVPYTYSGKYSCSPRLRQQINLIVGTIVRGYTYWGNYLGV